MSPIIKLRSARNLSDKNICALLCIAMVLLTGFFSLLLWKIYPDGVVTAESPLWLLYLENFKLSEHFYGDLGRRPVVSALFQLAVRMPNPGLFVLVSHCLLFVAAIASTYFLARTLAYSKTTSVIFTSALLVAEIALMKVFAQNVFFESEPMYAYLLWIGCTLLLGGTFHRKKAAILFGCLALGITSVTRINGIVLVPACLVLLLISHFLDNPLRNKRFLTICLAFIVVPNAFFVTRKAYLGISEAYSPSYYLFIKTLPLVTENDSLIDHPTLNKELVRNILSFTKENTTEQKGVNDWSFFLKSFYEINEYEQNGRSTKDILIEYGARKNRSEAGQLAMGIGLNLAKAHPLKFTRLIASTFAINSSPIHHCGARVYENPNRRFPHLATPDIWKDGNRLRALERFYPNQKSVTSNPQKSYISILRFACDTLVDPLQRRDPDGMMTLLTLLISLLATCFILIRKWLNNPSDSAAIAKTVTIVFLVSIVMLQNGSSAVFHYALHRYSHPTEIPINFLCILFAYELLSRLLAQLRSGGRKIK